MEIESLLNDGDEHISRYGDPDLNLDRVLRRAEEGFDTKALVSRIMDLPLPRALIASKARTPSTRRTRICLLACALPRMPILSDSRSKQFTLWTLRSLGFSAIDQQLTVYVREFYRTRLGLSGIFDYS